MTAAFAPPARDDLATSPPRPRGRPLSRRRLAPILALVLGAGTAAPDARAVCASAPLAREYREADLIVRARAVSETNAWNDEPTPAYRAQWGDEESVVLYGLRVEAVYKGSSPRAVRFYDGRNSGAFYMDVGERYLLFLSRYDPADVPARAARGAFYVRYACSQSKPWAEVGPGARAALRRLAGPRRAGQRGG